MRTSENMRKVEKTPYCQYMIKYIYKTKFVSTYYTYIYT